MSNIKLLFFLFFAATAIPYSHNYPTDASCVNWNQYYTNCTQLGNNPFQGTISFDNIGLAWVAIFLVIITFYFFSSFSSSYIICCFTTAAHVPLPSSKGQSFFYHFLPSIFCFFSILYTFFYIYRRINWSSKQTSSIEIKLNW